MLQRKCDATYPKNHYKIASKVLILEKFAYMMYSYWCGMVSHGMFHTTKIFSLFDLSSTNEKVNFAEFYNFFSAGLLFTGTVGLIFVQSEITEGRNTVVCTLRFARLIS